jgi:hypothetical protein
LFRSAEGSTYKCRGPGALLSLPHDGYRQDVIRTKVFEDYIRDHVVSWFDWSKRTGLGVERMEDLILVTGCTMVTSWGAIAFVDQSQEAEISLAVQALPNGGGSYAWNKIHRAAYHNSPVRFPGCFCSPCADFSFVLSIEQSIPDTEPMRLYQGLPSKTPLVLDRAHPRCRRTAS